MENVVMFSEALRSKRRQVDIEALRRAHTYYAKEITLSSGNVANGERIEEQCSVTLKQLVNSDMSVSKEMYLDIGSYVRYTFSERLAMTILFSYKENSDEYIGLGESGRGIRISDLQLIAQECVSVLVKNGLVMNWDIDIIEEDEDGDLEDEQDTGEHFFVEEDDD